MSEYGTQQDIHGWWQATCTTCEHTTARCHSEQTAIDALAGHDQVSPAWDRHNPDIDPTGGWVIVLPDGSHMTPHNALAYRTEAAAGHWAQSVGGRPMWTSHGRSAGGQLIPLTADYWKRVDQRDDPIPVGVVEIAQRLGVRRQTVDNWRQRPESEFPSAELTIGGRPAWRWSTVRTWAEVTRRLPGTQLERLRERVPPPS